MDSLTKVKGLGASGSGVLRWLLQRATGVLVLLISSRALFMLFSLLFHNQSIDSHTTHQLCKNIDKVLFSSFLIIGLFHGIIGIRIILEDYVSNLFLRRSLYSISILFTSFTGLMLLISIFQ